MFVIDTQSKLPIFEQLKKQILEFITIGILSPNDKLPSVRAMDSRPSSSAKQCETAFPILMFKNRQNGVYSYCSAFLMQKLIISNYIRLIFAFIIFSL